MSPFRQALGLAFFILLCFAVAGIGSSFTMPSVGDWYREISKPDWTPPSWLFGPVWTVLYLMMGVAAWLVWRRTGLCRVGVPLGIFGVQLALNLLWSIIFFGLHNPGLAFVEIVLLWLAILATILAFLRVSRLAGWLLVPYILWVTFASVLNFTIWNMNRG